MKSDVRIKLEEMMKKYGEARVLSWCEGYLKVLERAKNPEARIRANLLAKQRRTKKRAELEELRAQTERLKQALLSLARTEGPEAYDDLDEITKEEV
jgi:hypothetical protein